jgi:hypothetical protein
LTTDVLAGLVWFEIPRSACRARVFAFWDFAWRRHGPE